MNAILWWAAVVLSVLLVIKAWQNLLHEDRPRLKRRIYLSIFWFVLALGLPACAALFVSFGNRWAWLLVALATNSLLMMGCDCLLAKRDVARFVEESRQ